MATQSSSLSLISGPQLLGSLFNWALLGTLNLQVYLYHTHFPQDHLSLKCLVYGMLVFEWVQTGLITAQLFDGFVYHYGDPTVLTSTKWLWFPSPVMGSIVAATVQIYFAWRIFKFAQFTTSRRAPACVLVGIIVLLAVGQAVCGIVGGCMIRTFGSSQNLENAEWPLSIWLGMSAADDVIIATTMTALLLYSKTGARRTDAIIDQIVRLTVETGTITATFALLAVILASISETNTTLLYQFPTLVLTKLYANTFLTNLNNRAFIAKDEAAAESLQFSSQAHVNRGLSTEEETMAGQEEHELSVPGASSQDYLDSKGHILTEVKILGSRLSRTQTDLSGPLNLDQAKASV